MVKLIEILFWAIIIGLCYLAFHFFGWFGAVSFTVISFLIFLLALCDGRL